MPEKEPSILAAYKRMAILKAITGAERTRAESNRYDQRNLELGIIEPDQPRTNLENKIRTLFNQIELLLDHLTLLHMAASFESEAKVRLDTVAGAAHKTIQGSRERSGGWATRLVRGADSFDGLYDIGEVLGLTASDLNAFKTIRKVRNAFSHGVALETVPPITAEDARDVLVATLARIK